MTDSFFFIDDQNDDDNDYLSDILDRRVFESKTMIEEESRRDRQVDRVHDDDGKMNDVNVNDPLDANVKRNDEEKEMEMETERMTLNDFFPANHAHPNEESTPRFHPGFFSLFPYVQAEEQNDYHLCRRFQKKKKKSC